MKQIYLFDDEKVFTGVDLIDKEAELPINATDIRPADGMYRAVFDGEKWNETITSEEVQEMNKSAEPEPTVQELKGKIETLEGAIIDLTNMMMM